MDRLRRGMQSLALGKYLTITILIMLSLFILLTLAWAFGHIYIIVSPLLFGLIFTFLGGYILIDGKELKQARHKKAVKTVISVIFIFGILLFVAAWHIATYG